MPFNKEFLQGNFEKEKKMPSPNLTGKILAERWNIRPATLRQWRWNDRGPKFFKAGGRVLYKIQEIEKFEEKTLRESTTISDDMSMDFS
jgi:transposase-like protein